MDATPNFCLRTPRYANNIGILLNGGTKVRQRVSNASFRPLIARQRVANASFRPLIARQRVANASFRLLIVRQRSLVTLALLYSLASYWLVNFGCLL